MWSSIHLKAGSDHDEKISLVLVFGDGIVEFVTQAFAEEHDVRLQDRRNRKLWKRLFM